MTRGLYERKIVSTYIVRFFLTLRVKEEDHEYSTIMNNECSFFVKTQVIQLNVGPE